MLHYTTRRLLTAIPTLLVISFIIFAVLDLAPGDPTAELPLTIPPEVRQQIRESLGLGQPFHIRYLAWLNQFFVNEPLNILERLTGWTIGDSENRLRVSSWATRSPVVDLIIERLPQTLWVVGLSYVIGALIAIPLGVVSAYKQYSWIDQFGTLFSMIGFSVPTFFTGLLFIIVFSVWLGWLPSLGRGSPYHLILPALTLATFELALYLRLLNSAFLQEMGQDYVRTAKAKGGSRARVLIRHVLPNAMLPIVTIAGINLGVLLGGAIVTETVFSWPGVGRLVVQAVSQRDYPVVIACVFVISLVFVLLNLIVDLLYAVLDPRVRYA